MRLIETIKTIAGNAIPAYHFEFEGRKMENVKADDTTFPLIFFEEYVQKDGQYTGRYGWRKRQPIELYFLRLAPLDADAVTREALREQIESEAVLPFLEALNGAQVFDSVDDVRVVAVPPMFDTSAVGLLLSFDVTYNTCAL